MSYKVISKILVNRIRTILDDIILKNQSTFIPRKMISKNIMLAHELLTGYHKDKLGYCALKIDLQKAYDSISWDFLEEVLIAFRFPGYFIKLIMNSVRVSMFSIMING